MLGRGKRGFGTAGTRVQCDCWCRTKKGPFDLPYPPHLGGLPGLRL